MRIDIMGSSWEIIEKKEQEEPRLENADGICDWTTRSIVIRKEADGNLADMSRYIRKVTRHEIVHAFLIECGLDESSAEMPAWARNEEMVDWFARLGPRIGKAWEAAGVAEW